MPRPNNRERIVNTSLTLFNENGERSVSTNHVAASLDISPGNLYYYFANKQGIVAVLFDQYESRVVEFLHPPQGRSATITDIRGYLEGLIAALWDYRFLYRDLEHLLASDPQLAARYRAFSQRCLRQGHAIIEGLVRAGILVMQPRDVESLALNAWIVLTSWVRYEGVSQPLAAALDQVTIKRGVYQMLALIVGFVSPGWRESVQALCEEFYVPLKHNLQNSD